MHTFDLDGRAAPDQRLEVHMPKKSITNLLAAVAVAAGQLAGPAPAHAQPLHPLPEAPGCTRFGFTGSEIVLNLDNGVRITVPWDSNAKTFAGTGYASLFNPGAEDRWEGPVNGVIDRNSLDFDISWTDVLFYPFGGGEKRSGMPQPYPTNKVAGSIDAASMTAKGNTVNEKGVSTGWTSDARFECIDAPAAAAAAPEGKPTRCYDGTTVPFGEECPKKAPAAAPKPPTDAIRMVITKEGFNVKVTVTSTADIAGRCTYDATEINGLGLPVNQTFDIAPKGTKELTFPAPLFTQTYRVVVACRGDFNGEDVEFGRQEQNV